MDTSTAQSLAVAPDSSLPPCNSLCAASVLLTGCNAGRLAGVEAPFRNLGTDIGVEPRACTPRQNTSKRAGEHKHRSTSHQSAIIQYKKGLFCRRNNEGSLPLSILSQPEKLHAIETFRLERRTMREVAGVVTGPAGISPVGAGVSMLLGCAAAPASTGVPPPVAAT